MYLVLLWEEVFLPVLRIRVGYVHRVYSCNEPDLVCMVEEEEEICFDNHVRTYEKNGVTHLVRV
jgi:hypothetical protein